MTAKEKAKELVEKFATGGWGKENALIAVDEILDLDVVWYDEQLVKDYPKTYKPNQTIEYWEQVKSEINLL